MAPQVRVGAATYVTNITDSRYLISDGGRDRPLSLLVVVVFASARTLETSFFVTQGSLKNYCHGVREYRVELTEV